LKTADTLLAIAEAFRGLREFEHELSTYKRVRSILDKVEEVLCESRGVSTRQTAEILNEILVRRIRSEDGERSSKSDAPAAYCTYPDGDVSIG
jgi:hypothetical protein